jgi:large repetitive protein
VYLLNLLMLVTLMACNVSKNGGDSGLVSGHLPTSNRFTVINPPNRTYTTSNSLDFYLIFPYPVEVSGTPHLTLTIGGATRFANYVSGSGSSELHFRHTVGAGENAPSGIAVAGTINLNGGTLTFNGSLGPDNCSTSITVPATNNIRVDTIAPTVNSVSAPMARTYYRNQHIIFNVATSEPVFVSGSPRLPLVVGATTKYARYISGSGTSNLVFRYTVESGDLDSNGIEVASAIEFNGGLIRDAAFNQLNLNLTPPVTTGVILDGNTPYVTSITSPANGTYAITQHLDYTINFSEAVTITGTPALTVTIGAIPVKVQYLSGNNSNQLVFRHTVTAADFDNDGVSLANSFDLTTGAIHSLLNNTALLNSFIAPATPNVRVAPGVARITNFTWTNKVYKFNEQINITAIFDKSVTVVGDVRLPVMIGGNLRYFNGQASTGTTVTFQYTVVEGEVDLDGISILSPLNLSADATSIKDGEGHDAAPNFTPPATPDVRVEATRPVITSVNYPASNNYTTGQFIDVTVNFSEPVLLENSAFIKMRAMIGGNNRAFDYHAGSGSSMTFRYVVTSADLDNNGIEVLSPLEITGAGSIKDAAGNEAFYTFSPQATPGVYVNYVFTNITSVTPPSDGTYVVGQNLVYNVIFSEAVNVIGNPLLPLSLGGTNRTATLVGGSGSNTLTFSYTVQASDNSIGVTVGPNLQLNEATIRNNLNNDANVSFVSLFSQNIIVQGTLPTISFIGPPANGTYRADQAWTFTANLSEAVTVTGSPQLQINIGGQTKYAAYQSHSGSTITFLYTTQAGDNDNDGIEVVSPLLLNSGSIQNSLNVDFNLNFTPPNTTAVRVDTTAPTISNVSIPAAATYGVDAHLDFVVTFNETISYLPTPRLSLNIGGQTRYANVHAHNGANLTFRYTVQSGDSANGITISSPIDLNTGAISDVPGNPAVLSFSAPDASGIIVQATAPTITAMVPPTAGSYRAGQELNFLATFSTDVVITGSPRLQLDIGGVTRFANFLSCSTTTQCTFSYTIVAPDTDTDGISTLSSLQHFSGSTIKDNYGNDANLTFTAMDTSGILIDTTIPTITGLVVPTNATYVSGNELLFTVNFSEAVIVSGTPQLPIVIGSTTVYANYQSGGGTTALLFRHVIQSGALDTDGITLVSPLFLSFGSTIRDAAANNAILSYTPPSTTGILVDAVLPFITSITPPGNGAYRNGNFINFTVNFNKSVIVNTGGGTPRIPIRIGSNVVYANYFSGSSSASLIFRYSPAINELDLDGIEFVGTALELNSGTILDSLSNSADLVYPSLPELKQVFVVHPAFKHWYDLDEPSMVTTTPEGANDVIDSVTDIMGAINLTATGTARPLYNAAGFGPMNRGNAQFDGVNDILNFVTAPTFKSMILVFRSQSAASTTGSVMQQSGGAQNTRRRTELVGNGGLSLVESGQFRVNAGTFSANAASHTWAWAASTNYILMVNWPTRNNRTTQFGSAGFNGRLAAMILLDDTDIALSETDYSAIRTQLNLKYEVYP